MTETTTTASVRIVVLDGDQTVRAALTAMASSWPIAVAYTRLDPDGLAALERIQPQIVLLDGARVQDQLPALVASLAQLRGLHQLILLGGEPAELPSLPGIQVLTRTGSEEALGQALQSLLQPVLSPPPAPGPIGAHRSREEHLVWLGSLSAMLAHEINGPIDGARRFLRLAREQLGHGRDIATHLDEIERALQHVARLGKSLLTFERGAAVPGPARPLGELLAEVEAYVRSHTGEHAARVEARLDDPRQPVPDAMFQVLANLLSNSLQAMSGRGLVRISSRAASGALEIVVADDGPGMPAAYREALFKPFFSTKPYGQGSGLGLPICRQIVQSLGGTLAIESRPGEGTTVTVSIPAPRIDS